MFCPKINKKSCSKRGQDFLFIRFDYLVGYLSSCDASIHSLFFYIAMGVSFRHS